ncbi:MAG: CoA pyrophosphatase [Myxococcota bacterium]|nr:CoA pyrophosphatase [Myxococcota bacterium]
MDSAFDNLIRRIRNITRGPRTIINRNELTKAAVLVPIVGRHGAPHLILTKRTMTVAKHKGEISFPGGAREPEDEDEIANALREAHEEIGLNPKQVSVMGLLDDFPTMTGFSVTPVVGWVNSEAALMPDPVEVAEMIELPFSDLQDPAVHELVKLGSEPNGYRFHSYQVSGHVVWGATAGIIYRFLSALNGGNDP